MSATSSNASSAAPPRSARAHPVVVSKFEVHAREVEIDAVADAGRLVLYAISEHVEDAGVHSGDATLVLPPQRLYIETIRRVKKIAASVAAELDITGPFNMQFLARHNAVKVIECNLRASRSFPFVSKVTGNNFVAEAMRRMLGVRQPIDNHSLDLDLVAVKAPKFSFDRLAGADPILGVEMASTGEVGCFGDDLHEALLHAMQATGFRFPRNGVLLSLGPVEDKFWFADEARAIADELGLAIYATEGTAEALGSIGIACVAVAKEAGPSPSAISLIDAGDIDLVINIPAQLRRSRPARRLHDPPPRGRGRAAADHRPPARPRPDRGAAPPRRDLARRARLAGLPEAPARGAGLAAASPLRAVPGRPAAVPGPRRTPNLLMRLFEAVTKDACPTPSESRPPSSRLISRGWAPSCAP